MTPAEREVAQMHILAAYLAKLDRRDFERRQASRVPRRTWGRFGNQNAAGKDGAVCGH